MNKKTNSEYSCDLCNKTIKGIKAYYILGHKKNKPDRRGYCSKQCSNTAHKSNKIDLCCTNCEKKFKRLPSDVVSENNFCSRSCSAKWNNVIFIKRKREHVEGTTIRSVSNGKIEIQKLYKECLGCNKEFELKKKLDKFCSHKCQHIFQHVKFISEWKAGTINVGRGQTVSKHIRTYLFEKYKHKCSSCGWDKKNPVTKNSPLEVEHINGNSKDNREENLTLLCPNCHSLTPTYKNLNKGRGRHERMVRYKEGKSY